MLNAKKIFFKKVSFQKNAYAPLTHELTIENVLSGIKEQRLISFISNLRYLLSNGDNREYNERKKMLPGVTFCATFNKKRQRDKIKEYNELIVIDIDKLDSYQLTKYKSILMGDEYVLTFWESPSKLGLKGLIPISFDNEIDDIDIAHKIAFKKLVQYFRDEYNIELDESGSDTTRLCFLSSDSNLVLKSNYNNFAICDDDFNKFKSKVVRKEKNKNPKVKIISKKAILLNPEGKNSPKDRLVMSSIIRFLTKRGLSITDSYDKWYRVAFAISNSFTHDIGEKYFLKLCRLDGKKHFKIESENLLLSCYESTYGEISFNTIYHYAKELGYKQKK